MKDEQRKESVRCTCGAWTDPKILRIEGLKIRGSTCPKCGETYLNGEDAAMLSEFRRLKDTLLEGKVGVTGNSYTIRIPMGLVKALGLRKGDKVAIKITGAKEIVVNTC